MASSTTIDAFERERDAALPRVPNQSLRRKLAVVLVAALVASSLHDAQYLPFMAIPLALLWATPRVATLVLLGFAALLVTVGGLLTTYREGMAVLEWPRTLEYGMVEYPLSRLVDPATPFGLILEHSHRLIATALGLAAIGVCLSTFVHRSRTALKVMAGATLVAICIQGVIGGTRVLEVSQTLAFLHGTIAQAVFAMMAVLAAMASHAWIRAERAETTFARGAHGLGPWVVGLLYFQLGIGAWLRHHGQTAALLVHATYALFVVVMVMVFARQLGSAAKDAAERGKRLVPLVRLERVLLVSIGLQFLLGVLATVGIYVISGGMTSEVSVGEAVFATAHVVVGTVLFSSTVVGAVWAKRALSSPKVTPAAESAL